MIALPLALIFGFCTLTPHAAHAQTGRIEWPRRLDCDVTRRAFDNPWSDTKGYVMPRIGWHASYAVASLGMGYGLKKLGAPSWVAATVPTIGIGLVPHIRGHLKGYYSINIADWVFDFWNRATPTFWSIAHRHDDSASGVHWRRHAIATGTWTLGYLATVCFASP
jgi:hypothetical protein